MKRLAVTVFGAVFAASVASAETAKLSDDVVTRLHAEMNICNADAATSAVPQFDQCSVVLRKLIKHYGSYIAYRTARNGI